MNNNPVGAKCNIFPFSRAAESAVARAKLRANAQSSWSHRDFDGL
jgi:hypothetical protein